MNQVGKGTKVQNLSVQERMALRRRRRRIRVWRNRIIACVLLSLLIFGIISLVGSCSSKDAEDPVENIDMLPGEVRKETCKEEGLTQEGFLYAVYYEDTLVAKETEASFEFIMPDFTIPQGKLYSRAWIADQQKMLAECMALDFLTEKNKRQIEKALQVLESLPQLLDSTTGVEDETVELMLAKIVTNEIGGLDIQHAYSTPEMERAAVVWCVLNRVREVTEGQFSPAVLAINTISVAKKPNAFAYTYDCVPFKGTTEIVDDVVIRYVLERSELLEDVGRVLPTQYTFFGAVGDGWHNRFRDAYKAPYNVWDWNCQDPYAQVS